MAGAVLCMKKASSQMPTELYSTQTELMGKKKKNAANNSVAYKLWPWFFPGLSGFFFPRPKKEDLRH